MSTDRPDSQSTGRDSRATVSIKEAADRLGLSVDAVRSRLHRGTLEGEKVGNIWRVYVPDDAEETASYSEPTVAQPVATVADSRPTDALVEHLEGEVAYLREQLATTIQQLAAERERADILQREALGRIEALTATVGVPESSDPIETGDQGMDVARDTSDAPASAWARFRRWWSDSW